MLSQEEVKSILIETNVLSDGHFLLTSGKHANQYMQCAQLHQYADKTELVCRSLAEYFQDKNVEVVVGPALGGIIFAYELSRILKVRNIFTERENGKMTLRRGYSVAPGSNVLVVEDVVTTGGSVKEVIHVMEDAGANIVGVAAIVDRSNGQADFGYPFHALISVQMETYEPENCPLCQKGIPIVKPGSRKTANV